MICPSCAQKNFGAISAELFVDLTPAEAEELRILTAGGVDLSDWFFAVDAWGRARSVGSDWGYLRTAMLVHCAERALMRRQVRAELNGAAS